jgi:hypothetical protein
MFRQTPPRLSSSTHAVLYPSCAAFHAVLVLQPVQQHVELEDADRADERRGTR